MNGSQGLGIGFGIVFALVIVAFYAAMIWATVNIIRRAGYSGWWVLIGLVPIANIVMFFVFAFAEWPTMRELTQLRAAVHGAGGMPSGGFAQPGYPQSGGFAQPGYPPSGGFAQPGYPPSGGFAQPDQPGYQPGYQQGGYQQGGYQQPGQTPGGGSEQGGYPPPSGSA